MIKTITAFLFSLILVQGVFSQDTAEFFKTSDAFFGKHVKNGLIDYKAIQQNTSELDAILDLAKNNTVGKDDAKIYQAFWINGYNLLVIKGIVENYPVKSPLDINGFFDAKKYEIGGKKITLNDIENTLLRENFKDEARFHFVLVCAGLGCPPIIDEAYLPEKLEMQLQGQTELALNNPNFIRTKGKKVLLSQIFEWYKVDFVKNGQTEIDFINHYRNEKLDANSKIGYYPYDWTLNETK